MGKVNGIHIYPCRVCKNNDICRLVAETRGDFKEVTYNLKERGEIVEVTGIEVRLECGRYEPMKETSLNGY